MKHFKKMLAPIIITALLVLYYVGIIILFIFSYGIPLGIKLLMIIVPLLLCSVIIGVLVSRIKEIQGGEEDDLSKY